MINQALRRPAGLRLFLIANLLPSASAAFTPAAFAAAITLPLN
jgi:hypothetical protein